MLFYPARLCLVRLRSLNTLGNWNWTRQWDCFKGYPKVSFITSARVSFFQFICHASTRARGWANTHFVILPPITERQWVDLSLGETDWNEYSAVDQIHIVNSKPIDDLLDEKKKVYREEGQQARRKKKEWKTLKEKSGSGWDAKGRPIP